jgi:alkylated DNA repair protein (DNA oxidative demethylase)
MDALLPRPPARLGPGAVHLPGWLGLPQQQRLVAACRRWASGPVPLRHTRLPGGGVMSVQTVCLGWHWQPYRYSRTADDVNGARVAELPQWLADLGRRALSDAAACTEGVKPADSGEPAWDAGSYAPDTALVNFYDGDAKMGMHQDKDEKSSAPVVSLSIGDTCRFRFGNTAGRGKPYTDLELASGDLFVFGGPDRFAYHGVTKVYQGTGDPATGLTQGRLNITLRVTGLGDPLPRRH